MHPLLTTAIPLSEICLILSIFSIPVMLVVYFVHWIVSDFRHQQWMRQYSFDGPTQTAKRRHAAFAALKK